MLDYVSQLMVETEQLHNYLQEKRLDITPGRARTALDLVRVAYEGVSRVDRRAIDRLQGEQK